MSQTSNPSGIPSLKARVHSLGARLLPNRRRTPVPRHPRGRARPELVRFSDEYSTTRLTIAEPSRGSAQPVLLLVGRKSRLEVGLVLVEGPDGWSATVGEDDLAIFGLETVDLFVGGAAVDGTQSRRRVTAGGGVVVESRPGAVRRWYTTAEGNVSVRRPSAVEVIIEAGVFDEELYRGQVPDLPPLIDPIEHYVTVGAAEGLNPSTMFETAYYLKMNGDVRRRNPLAHYCEQGWRELRNPSPLFNTWWYWSKHLDAADDSVNPLAHYEQVGRQQRLSTHPDRVPSRSFGPGHRFDAGQVVRRVCLFAAYDRDGIVDDYVVDFVRELSRHADVYYLADAVMADAELAKLAELTKGAWGIPHGEYDFGSYSRLAEMVGWTTIEQYDELLLVNDSCYLLRPLDEVFARMDASACDWWGLQATKGIGPTRRHPVNQFRDPIPMESVRIALVDGFEQDYIYDFHVASFFLAYRKPVIEDPEFRRYLASVTSQHDKFYVILKYEIGMTHWLIQHGHSFDTFLSRLYRFHGSYTKWYARLLDEGFPLLKRRFLAENPFRVPRLADWTELVRSKAPGADIAAFERNLVRVTDPEKLYRSLHIGESVTLADGPVPDSLLTAEEFAEADTVSPKHADWWAFPVDQLTQAFSGNERAIFEEVKDDPAIRKIVLTRGKDLVVNGTNVEVVPLESPEGQHRLMRSGTILIKHSRDVSVVYPVSSALHNLIKVGQGIPFARTGYTSTSRENTLDRITQEQADYRAVISSSKVDTLARAAACYPLTFHQVWNTGLPRNDFIVRAEDRLPTDYQAELARLRGLVGDRRMVLFMPAVRDAEGDDYHEFTPAELNWLDEWLRTNGCVLGVREPVADPARPYSAQFASLPSLDLSAAEFAHVELLYRESAALITDYSDAFIDFLLTGKPAVSFAAYESCLRARVGSYDLDFCFPGPICKDFTELRAALRDLLDTQPDEAYEFKRRIFFDLVDDQSSVRVAEKIRDLTAVYGIGKWAGEHVA